MTMGKGCAPPLKITVMSELYAVVYVVCNVFHIVTSDPWCMESESLMDDWKKLKVCDCKGKRLRT
jgi:hypothetical protein